MCTTSAQSIHLLGDTQLAFIHQILLVLGSLGNENQDMDTQGPSALLPPMLVGKTNHQPIRKPRTFRQ